MHEGDPRIGLVLGVKVQVRLVRRIGEGGMGTVYLAESTTSGLPYAVKLLQPRLCQRDVALRRFFREAMVASSIHHPGVVGVVDTGRGPDGAGYYVMELLTGEDLATTLRRDGRLPWSRVLHIALQVCDAMAVVHAHDVVHRDLKPANCFRTVRGADPDAIKILDFGVAKIAADDVSLLTGADAFLGTVPYMAPELLRANGARDGDARGDIWALAVTIQELLTGSRPFHSDNVFALIGAIQHDRPAPLGAAAVRPDWPAGLQSVLDCALAGDPQQRFPDMHALALALRALEAPTPAPRTIVTAADPLAATAQLSTPVSLAPPSDDDATVHPTPPSDPDGVEAVLRDISARSFFYVDPDSRWRHEPQPMPGGTLFAVVRGDLCLERVDAVVCDVARDGLQRGTLAWRLCEFGGPEVAAIADVLPTLPVGAVHCVPGGRLAASHVFFVVQPDELSNSPAPRVTIARAVADCLDRRKMPAVASLSVALFMPQSSGMSRQLVLESIVKAFARQLAISPPFTLGTLRIVLDDRGERLSRYGGECIVHLPDDLVADHLAVQRFELGRYSTAGALASAIWSTIPAPHRPPLEHYGTRWTLRERRSGRPLAPSELFTDDLPAPHSAIVPGVILDLDLGSEFPIVLPRPSG